MRTTSRLAVSAALLGGGLLLAAPASAQETCEYPFDCPPIGGGEEEPGSSDGGDEGGGRTVDASPTSGGSLPFTGGEVTLMALAGTAALGGGIVLVAAGRKRSTV